MKVGGRKNDGAWFRTNKFIQSLETEDRNNLETKLNGIDTIDAAFNALVALKEQTVVTMTGFPGDRQEWVTKLADNGIPRQIWYGRLTWTTYSQDEVTQVWTANYQSPMHYFAVDLRRTMKEYMMALRELRDVGNILNRAQGNPGGLPDANLLQ